MVFVTIILCQNLILLERNKMRKEYFYTVMSRSEKKNEAEKFETKILFYLDQ